MQTLPRGSAHEVTGSGGDPRLGEGQDLTALPGLTVTTALAVVSEAGATLMALPAGKHFASWPG